MHQDDAPDSSDFMSRARGAVLGAAIGDALGMPLEGLSHQNVRTYYRGVRGFVDDEKRRDLGAGQWTFRTQQAIALAKADREAGSEFQLGDAVGWRRLAVAATAPPGSAPASVAPVAVRAVAGGWAREATLAFLESGLAARYSSRASIAAALGQAHAIRLALTTDVRALDGMRFVRSVADATSWAEVRLGSGSACSERLARLAGRLDSFPLDLQEDCDGTGFEADQAWPFAIAMFARRPGLVEATLLSAVNVGGDAPTVGACVGALLGAAQGEECFPKAWMEGVEAGDRLAAVANSLIP